MSATRRSHRAASVCDPPAPMRSAFRVLLLCPGRPPGPRRPGPGRRALELLRRHGRRPAARPVSESRPGGAADARRRRRHGPGRVLLARHAAAGRPPIDFAESDRRIRRARRTPTSTCSRSSSARPPGRPAATRARARCPTRPPYGTFVGEFVKRYGAAGRSGPRTRACGPSRCASSRSGTSPTSTATSQRRATPWPQTLRAAAARRAATRSRPQDPSARVVAAGPDQQELGGPRQALRAPAARGLFDAAAIHPFSARVSNVVKIVRLARGVMRKRGDARKPLMLTEVSWSSGKGESTFNYGWETTERGQATKVREALTRARARAQAAADRRGLLVHVALAARSATTSRSPTRGCASCAAASRSTSPRYGAFKSTVKRLRAR